MVTRCFFIAEAGVNHNGDPDLAHRLIDVAVDAGADAIKFQTFNPKALTSATAPKAAYQKGASRTQQELLEALVLPDDVYPGLIRHATDRGITFLSTPFDEASADFLASLDVPVFKIGSGDLTHHPLLQHVAKLGRPMIISTGMSVLREIGDAITAIHAAGGGDLTLLHCVSSYPAPADQANLRAMVAMKEAFQLPVGYSDHTDGTEVALAAVALGASVIEKHITLDRSMAGPDHAASLEPFELRHLVNGIRTVSKCLGDGLKRRRPCEEDVARVARRSIHLNQDLEAGTILRPEHLVMLRPGTGIPPGDWSDLVGRRLLVALPRHAILQHADLSRRQRPELPPELMAAAPSTPANSNGSLPTVGEPGQPTPEGARS